MSTEDFIKQWEGCKLQAYADRGRVTIGYGHTGNVAMGTTWTQLQADQALAEDIATAQAGIKDLVTVPLNDNQLTALTSFVFNLGKAQLGRSGLLRLLNQGNYDKAADQLLLWCYIGLYKSPGLLARRTAERALFLNPVE